MRQAGLWGLAGLWLCACGGRAVAPPEEESASPPEEVLLGSWETEGVDARLGPLRVRMVLAAGGQLGMRLFLPGGGQRSFPGTWALEGSELVLRGAYFGPAGERRLRWQVRAGEVLVLVDEQGEEQVWQRRQ